MQDDGLQVKQRACTEEYQLFLQLGVSLAAVVDIIKLWLGNHTGGGGDNLAENDANAPDACIKLVPLHSCRKS